LATLAIDGFPGFFSRDHREQFPGGEGILNPKEKNEQTRGAFGRFGLQLRREAGNESIQFLILFCWTFSGCLSNPNFSLVVVFFIKGSRFGVWGRR
jgi:hypothetical protein